MNAEQNLMHEKLIFHHVRWYLFELHYRPSNLVSFVLKDSLCIFFNMAKSLFSIFDFLIIGCKPTFFRLRNWHAKLHGKTLFSL